MISHTAEYALRSIVWLASHPGLALSTQQISTATKVPAGYLSKVLQALARAGLVSSSPGRRGGFRLARSPKRICVLDVINAVDGIQRIRKCPLGLRSHGRVLCPLHKRLDDAMAMMERAFANSTIAELLAEPSASTPLCEGNSFVLVRTSAALAKIRRTQHGRPPVRAIRRRRAICSESPRKKNARVKSPR